MRVGIIRWTGNSQIDIKMSGNSIYGQRNLNWTSVSLKCRKCADFCILLLKRFISKNLQYQPSGSKVTPSGSIGLPSFLVDSGLAVSCENYGRIRTDKSSSLLSRPHGKKSNVSQQRMKGNLSRKSVFPRKGRLELVFKLGLNSLSTSFIFVVTFWFVVAAAAGQS